MIKNYFYLIVGLLCILFAVTHTLNGTTTFLPVLGNVGMETGVKTTFTYIWHIIGAENLILGIALLVMAFWKNSSKVAFAAWLIIAILSFRWIIIATFTVMMENSIKQIIPDTVAMFVLIALLLFGLRVRPANK